MPPIQFTLLAVVQLTDYEGGTNPILLILFIGLIIFLLLLALGYALHKTYRSFRFQKICASSKMSGEEIGFLKTFLRRMHIEEPLDVITKKSRFDSFMNRVGHFYEGVELSEEELHKEEVIFRNMREKLQLPHKWKKPRLFTSRALPPKYPLHIICWDRETNQVFPFSTQVVSNNEFFLGVTPPDTPVMNELFQENHPVMEVSFQREKDAEYQFDSHLVRPVKYPENMWYIAHSKEMVRGTPLQSVELPAMVMLTNPDESGKVDEYSVTLHHLTNKGCTFRCDEKEHPFEEGPRTLISFDIESLSFTLRAQILSMVKQGETLLFRMNFDEVDEEENRALLQFMLKVKQEQKKKNSQKRKKTAAKAMAS